MVAGASSRRCFLGVFLLCRGDRGVRVPGRRVAQRQQDVDGGLRRRHLWLWARQRHLLRQLRAFTLCDRRSHDPLEAPFLEPLLPGVLLIREVVLAALPDAGDGAGPLRRFRGLRRVQEVLAPRHRDGVHQADARLLLPAEVLLLLLVVIDAGVDVQARVVAPDHRRLHLAARLRQAHRALQNGRQVLHAQDLHGVMPPGPTLVAHRGGRGLLVLRRLHQVARPSRREEGGGRAGVDAPYPAQRGPEVLQAREQGPRDVLPLPLGDVVQLLHLVVELPLLQAQDLRDRGVLLFPQPLQKDRARGEGAGGGAAAATKASTFFLLLGQLFLSFSFFLLVVVFVVLVGVGAAARLAAFIAFRTLLLVAFVARGSGSGSESDSSSLAMLLLLLLMNRGGGGGGSFRPLFCCCLPHREKRRGRRRGTTEESGTQKKKERKKPYPATTTRTESFSFSFHSGLTE
mmetsp:Transcript_2283/g.6270  ORF Transcript_2283/g.6270 Transcript_2283/m.6270 type:complete len:458 (+) Transcript_2283:1653-3026(+)